MSTLKDVISEAIFGWGLRNDDGHNLSMDDTDEIAEYIVARTPQPMVLEAEALARMFHETYESLAEVAGYETRLETRSFNLESPNGRLMVLVCAEIRKALLSAGKETV